MNDMKIKKSVSCCANADSKIEAETSPTRTRVKVDSDVTLWCNATGRVRHEHESKWTLM